MKNRIIILLIFLIPSFLFSNELDIFNSYEIRNNKFTNFIDAEVFIEEGNTKYKEHDLISAKEFYIKGLELATNPEWYYILGDILYDLKEYDISMKSYQLAGDLDYNRKDLAYYNAACTASLNKDEYHSYYYLQMALASGYNFWNHIENDSDLDLIKGSDTFNKVIEEYHIPEILIEYEEEFPVDLYLESLSLEVNLFGDNENELIFYCHIDGINEPLGTYFFCLYCKKSKDWELMNKTIPNHISIPDKYSTFNRIFERIETDAIKPPFMISNLDNDLDREILIPSGGMTYNSAKILDIQNSKLIEIGEIEGFEEIFSINDELYLVGHQVTDFGYGSGTSEEYSAYIINDGILEEREINKKIIEELINYKTIKFANEPNIINLSSLFWFIYNYDKFSLSRDWINRNIEKLEDERYKENFLKVMLEKIERY